MSYETWCKEFYPEDAKDVSKSEALDHSLTKWLGLLPENLKRYGLRVDGVLIFMGDVRVMIMNSDK